MLILSVIDRAAAAIECELTIIDMELAHPQRFVKPILKPVSNIRWAAKGAKAGIIELAVGLFRSGELTTLDGTELSFIDVIKAFEAVFNVDLHRLYVQRNQVLTRKKTATPFLRRLITIVEREAENMFR